MYKRNRCKHPVRRPQVTNKRIKRVAKEVEKRAADQAHFSKPKIKSTISAVQRWPKVPCTVRMFGWQAFGNPGPGVTSVILDVGRVIQNFKDYVPAYFQLHSITLITPRALTAPAQDSQDPKTAVYSTLVDVAFAFLGNWLRFCEIGLECLLLGPLSNLPMAHTTPQLYKYVLF